jgi:hypothetical protein
MMAAILTFSGADMASIDRLNQSAIAAADALPFYSASDGADRRTSVSQLATALAPLIQSTTTYITQYSTPAEGFNVGVYPLTVGGSVFLLLTPLASIAAGAITLPILSSASHGQEVSAHSTQSVSALTVLPNGAGISGAPISLAAGGFFKLRFDAINRFWYRIA